MTPEVMIDIFRSALQLLMMMVIVIITPGLLVGVVISVIQAVTQVNEQSLSFMPKLIMTFLVLMLCGAWIMRKMSDFTLDLIHNLLYLIG